MALPKTPSFRLDGKRALVAGGSSGIGLAAGVALAEAGAEVTLASRNADKLAAVVAEMTAAGMQASALALDVADVSAKNRDLNDGTYGVELSPRADGRTNVTVSHDLSGVRLGRALSVWFDDAIRDECDAYRALEAETRDWSMTGLFLRDLDELA